MSVSLHQLLKTMVERGGTDLHITTNSPPLIRVDGTLVTLSHPPMTAVDTKKLAYSVLTDAQKHRFEEHLELDISFGVKGLARFRANIYMQRGAVAGAFRRMQTKIEQFFSDPRTQRIFSFQAMYAGLAPHDALAIYTVIAYLDSVAGVSFPRGGMHAVPRALAGAALGTDESGTEFWGHASNSLVDLLAPTELRFRATTSAHGRTLHFKAEDVDCINYFRTGAGACCASRPGSTVVSV